MARHMTKFLTLLVLVLSVIAATYAQGPSDTNNTVATPTPTTVTPRPGTPTTTPPSNVPTPTTKKTSSGASTSADGSDDGNAKVKTPTPTPTTRAPAAAAVPAVTAPTAVPVTTTPSPMVLLDRTVKSEYGTRSPAANETSTATTAESTVSKMGSWLVPAVIGAVIVAALIFMTFFMRERREDGDDHNTPRRSDAFFEHPKTNTHHAPVPLLGDNGRGKAATDKDQTSMRTVAVGGAHHSPRANRVASTDSSPGFGAYNKKNAEGASVIF